MSTAEKNSSKNQSLSLSGRLASPRLAQVVMIVLGFVVFAVLIPLAFVGLGGGEAAHHVAMRSGLLLVGYALLAAALAVCMWRRMKGLKRRIGYEPKPRKRPAAESATTARAFDSVTATAVLRRAGYRHISVGDDHAWGVKWRFSPLGTILLHVAVLLGIASMAVSVLPGSNMSHLRAVEGGATVSTPEGVRLRVERLNVESGKAGVTNGLHAVVSTGSGRKVSLAPDLPTFIDPITVAVVEDYDLAPAFSLLPTNGPTPIAEKTAPLDLRLNGTTDRMTIDGGRSGRYRVSMRLDSRTGNPRMFVERKQGRVWRFLHSDRELAPGEVLNVGRARLRYDGMHRWALLRVHRNPQIPLMIITLVAAIAGTVGRLILPRGEATIAAFEGGCAVTVSVDAYKGSRSASESLARSLEGR